MRTVFVEQTGETVEVPADQELRKMIYSNASSDMKRSFLLLKALGVPIDKIIYMSPGARLTYVRDQVTGSPTLH